jgi:HlyD family secretion protein
VTYLVLLLGLTGALAGVLVRVPETVSGAVVLAPVRGADPVRASRAGIVAEVRVTEGQAVGADEPLLVVRSPAVGELAVDLRTFVTQREGDAERLANERQRHESQRLADQEERHRLTERLAHVTQRLEQQQGLAEAQRSRYESARAITRNEVEITRREIEFRRELHRVAKDLEERFEKAHREGFVSWLDHNNRKLEAAKLAIELQQLDRQLDSARLKTSQLEAEYAQQESEWRLATAQLGSEQRELRAGLDKLRHEADVRQIAHREQVRSLREGIEKAGLRVGALEAQLAQSRDDRLSVAAPCAGTVLRLRVQRAGAVVQPGEALAELACAGSRLQAELSLAPSAIALVRPGQSVKFMFDAFPYQRHGVRYGTVRWVSPAGLTVREEATFRVLADLEDQAVAVDGRPRPLLAGMGGRAEVVVGRRRLIDYMFEPLRLVREKMATRDMP